MPPCRRRQRSWGTTRSSFLRPRGTPYLLTVQGRNETDGYTGDLNYDSNLLDSLTITGGGAETTIIDGGHIDYEVFSYSGFGAVTMSWVTIRNGGAIFNGEPIGGAITGGVGALYLVNSVIRDSYAGFAGVGVFLTASTITGVTGMAIYADGPVVLDRSTISGNGFGLARRGGTPRRDRQHGHRGVVAADLAKRFGDHEYVRDGLGLAGSIPPS